MQRVRIHIQGIVQGVGFRPFIHKLVQSYGLKGYVKNSSSGVEMELEGERAQLESFVKALPEKAPKLAVIEKLRAEYSDELRGFSDFSIARSKTESVRNTLISPDICVCDDCLRELRDKNDRRYAYPFFIVYIFKLLLHYPLQRKALLNHFLFFRLHLPPLRCVQQNLYVFLQSYHFHLI